ncbi:diguanylate cyclase [Sporomusa aerivorans]|uniref:sensor domain-containing diguanylate cyclase n=1 Tax=Sporomusa aerivorans TaxID=204936 RepID=UPI00352A7E21
MAQKCFSHRNIDGEIEDILHILKGRKLKKKLDKKLYFILDSISVYITYINAGTLQYEFVNKAFARAYNIPREQIIGSHMNEILPEKNYQNAIRYIEEVRMGKAETYEHYFDVSIGKRWVKVDYIPEFDNKGNVSSFIVLGTDITDRKKAEEKVKESEALYRFIVETASEGILILNRDLIITFVNNKLAVMLGYEIEELIGNSFKQLLFEEHLGEFVVQLQKKMREEDAIYERYLRRKNGSKHWVIISVKAMMDDEGYYTGSFIMLTDIHSRKLIEEQLESAIKKLEVLSNIDGLTNLANRRYFDEIMSLEYDRLSRYGLMLSFIMIDIDYFKKFNDYYGHLCGDNCLQQVAKVLAGSACRPADIIARYGGEEFICMLPETDIEGAKVIAEKMRIGVERLHIHHNGSTVSDYVTISLGVATTKCSPSNKVLEFISNADKALYKAKASGRNTIEVF